MVNCSVLTPSDVVFATVPAMSVMPPGCTALKPAEALVGSPPLPDTVSTPASASEPAAARFSTASDSVPGLGTLPCLKAPRSKVQALPFWVGSTPGSFASSTPRTGCGPARGALLTIVSWA